MKPARCSLLADAELLTNPTIAAVSRHQKLGANRARAPAFPFADRGGDTLLILLETDQFGPEAQIPPQPPRLRAQHPPQPILSNGTAWHQADKEDAPPSLPP